MRKLISIVLSLLMVVSCMTCISGFPNCGASALHSGVTHTRLGDNLLADLKAADITDRDNWVTESDTTLTVGESTVNAIQLGYSQYQTYYFFCQLEADTTYQLEMSVKSNYKFNNIIIYKVDENFNNGSNTSPSGEYVVNKTGLGLDVSAGVNITDKVAAAKEFTITETAEYVFIFGGYGDPVDSAVTAQTGYLYNVSLRPYIDTFMGAEVVGNGTVKTVEGENSLTFTATPYQNSRFLGWYKGDTLISTDTVYTYNYTEIVPYTVKAKFTDVNLIADMVNTDWKGYNTVYGHVGNYSKETGNSYLGGNSVLLTGVSYQTRYFCVDLEAATTYNFQYYITNWDSSTINVGSVLVYKLSEVNNYRANSASIADYSEDIFNFRPTSYPDYCTYRKALTNTITSPTAWTKANKVSFTTDTAETYIIGIKFESCSAGVTNTSLTAANVSDWSLTKELEATVTSEGNGTATVSEGAANEFTFIATPYQDSEFEGWYVGETLLDTAGVYTTTLSFNTVITARFSDVNLLEGYKASNFVHKDGWGQITDSTVVIDGNTFDAVRVQSVGLSSEKFYGQKYSFSVELTAGVTYSLQMGVKSYYRPDSFAITHADNATFDSTTGNPSGSSSWLAYNGGLSTETKDGVLMPSETVANNAYKFVPTASGVHYIFITFVNNTSPTDDELNNAAANDYNGAYLYNMSLIDNTTYDVAVTASGNGAAKASANAVRPGKSVTLTATEYLSGGKFLGWYKDGTLVSTKKVITLDNISANVKYVAKFTKTNLAADLNYVASDYKSTGLYTTAGDGWKKSPTSWVTISNANEESRYGGTAISFTGTVQSQAFYLPLELKTGTKYSLSFSYYVTGVKLNEVALYKSDLNLHDGEEGESGSAGGMRKTGTVVSSAAIDTSKDWSTFGDFSATFTTDTGSEATQIYFLYIHHGDFTEDNSGGTLDKGVLSDLSIVEVGEEDIKLATFNGNSIRAEGTQALRYRFSDINPSIYSGFEGYTVKEFGALAIPTEYLSGAELALNGSYYYGGKERKATKGVFNEDTIAADGTVSIALYNIGVTKSLNGSIQSTYYSAYGNNYTVRLYLVIENPETGEKTTFYSKAQTASVFAVMEEILSSTDDDAQTLADQAAVNTVLGLTDTDTSGVTVQQAYDVWKKQ